MESERPMVLHVRVVSGTGGGPEKTILNSPRFLAPNGYDCLCAFMHPPNDPGFDAIRKKGQTMDAPMVEIPDRGPLDLRVIWRLVSLCRRHRVTIWHGHDYKSNALGLLVRRFHLMDLVSTAHGWVVRSPRRDFYYKIDRLCLRRYRRVICVSDDLMKTSVASGVQADRCTVIENAIDTDQFTRRSTSAEAKHRLGIHPDRTLIGSMGRLSVEKNFDGTIRAVARLINDGHNLGLIVIGDGDERARLETLIDELGCGDRISLLGYRTDTVELFDAMDLFVLNSLREGLPNVVLEAMSMRVPVVATRVAGLPRLIEDGKNGQLIDSDDEDALIESLRQLLDDARYRDALADAARQTIELRYSFAARMEKVRAIYDERDENNAHSN